MSISCRLYYLGCGGTVLLHRAERLDHATIVPGKDLSPTEKEWVRQEVRAKNETPATTYQIKDASALITGLGDELSITDPNANGCILSSIAVALNEFTTTVNNRPLVHRYVTDAGFAEEAHDKQKEQ
jgi:hypothetical protein